MTDDLYKEFCAWVDRILDKHSNVPVAAYNFNLYEQGAAFAVQLIGAKSFDLINPDWPCDEAFPSGEDLFVIRHSRHAESWRNGQRLVKTFVERYLKNSKHSELLKRSNAVGIGFVDGDLEYLHLRPDA